MMLSPLEGRRLTECLVSQRYSGGDTTYDIYLHHSDEVMGARFAGVDLICRHSLWMCYFADFPSLRDGGKSSNV